MNRPHPRLRGALASSFLGLVVLGGCQEARDTVTIRGLTAGDRACYITVEDGDGKLREEMALFELCERTDLVGKEVRLLFEKTQVQAESCQGNPECTDSVTAMLVQSVELP